MAQKSNAIDYVYVGNWDIAFFTSIFSRPACSLLNVLALCYLGQSGSFCVRCLDVTDNGPNIGRLSLKSVDSCFFYNLPRVKNKSRSVQELRSSIKLFRYFWFNFFEAVNFEFIVEKFCLVWFELSVWTNRQNKGFLVCFGWVWFGLLIPQKNKQIQR